MTPATTSPKRLAFFERYLTVWVFLCMIAGVGLGKLLPRVTAALSKIEFGHGSQVNVPIGILLWLMIYPMMLKVDFSALGGIARKPKGLAVTLFVNWLVKPFGMALLAWVFMQHVFAAWIDPETARNYTAGLIILAAAPCTAMVFVWSYLTDGDPAYTLVQVAVNDLLMLVAFAPIVMLLCGVAQVVVPAKVLITSVVVFIVIPLAAGWFTRTTLRRSHGKNWFEQTFLPKFHPVMIGALLLTLVLIFAFQAANLTTRWFAVLLIAVPIWPRSSACWSKCRSCSRSASSATARNGGIKRACRLPEKFTGNARPRPPKTFGRIEGEDEDAEEAGPDTEHVTKSPACRSRVLRPAVWACEGQGIARLLPPTDHLKILERSAPRHPY